MPSFPPRVACIVVPLFPLAARLRSEPELAGEAVAVFEGNGNSARVVAATRPARRAGIQPGHTLPQARALLPDLLARGRDSESERAAQEALAEAADGFSPRVETAGDGARRDPRDVGNPIDRRAREAARGRSRELAGTAGARAARDRARNRPAAARAAPAVAVSFGRDGARVASRVARALPLRRQRGA